jgi:hypothetical protein
MQAMCSRLSIDFAQTMRVLLTDITLMPGVLGIGVSIPFTV